MPERKLESISVTLGKELPEDIRLDKGISEDQFVEIRVERENPVITHLVPLAESPGKKFSRLLKEHNCKF